MLTIINIFTLAVKDIRLRIFNLGLTWLALVSASIILSLLPADFGSLPLFLFPVLAVAFLSLFYLEWLISDEKERGTFLLLRTLPVSDRAIISSKLITLGLLLAVHPLAVLPSALINPVNLLAMAVTGLTAVSVFMGCVWGILFFLVLRGANKYVIPFFAILLISLVALVMMKKFPWLPGFLMSLPAHAPAVILLTPFSCLLGWWLTCRYMSSRDSAELVD